MKAYYLKKAEENLPKLICTTIKPEVEKTTLKQGEELTIDLGNHYVGYFSFNMGHLDAYIDAPVRMEVVFCETKRELEDDFSSYKGGLCRSWLQDEIINVDFPGVYKMPRRYAARYVRIKIIASPQLLTLSDFTFEAVTSADMESLKSCEILDPELRAIDKVARNTLKNCMQRVFEDGPKRDRRLWIGDLRLEALANYYTFDNAEIVKRCLYLFASADTNEHKILPGFVYEYPEFYSGKWFLIDYALMFVCALCDYLYHTKDEKTFLDIYPVAKAVLDNIDKTRTPDGLANADIGEVFVDWCSGLEKNSALEGIYLYTLEKWAEALDSLGVGEEAKTYLGRLADGRECAYKTLFDERCGRFQNELDKRQYSVHTAVYMVLGGVVSGEEASRILLEAIHSPDTVKPFTPYMHHYTVEALFKAGLTDEAEKYIRRIWGGMVSLGADTFFEAYVPGDPEFSPYRDRMMNSMCHAWSCTATYFIRRYGLGRK